MTSEFEKWWIEYSKLALSHGFVLNDDEKCQHYHTWKASRLEALKWVIEEEENYAFWDEYSCKLRKEIAELEKEK